MRAISSLSLSLLLRLSLVVIAACAHAQRLPPQPFAGALPPDTRVDLAGTFAFSATGDLSLALAAPCEMGTRALEGGATVVNCDRTRLNAVAVVADTPWHQAVRGVWLDASHLVFRADWKATDIDPIADNAATAAARPWPISGTTWAPTPAQATQIVNLVGAATDTQADVGHGGPPPQLEVTSFEIAEGALRAGGQATLVVTIANRGSGPAYRVAASTRSSVASLHEQRLSFGLIRAGAEKTRQIPLSVGADEASPDTMLVLVLAEANGVVPRNVSHRVPIVAVGAPEPVAGPLAVHCSLPSKGARPEVSAGDTVSLHCVLDNTSPTAAQIAIDVTVGSGSPVHAPLHTVAAGGHADVDVPVTIPRDAALDATVELAVNAHDRKGKLTAHTSVISSVRKRKLCAPGELTRDQYRAKMNELRAAVTAGDMTAAQLDRYDAELVTCLK
jgi:hypothetical protein